LLHRVHADPHLSPPTCTIPSTQELNITLKNPFEVLALHRYYLLRPAEPKVPHQQWMSVILHEHGKTYLVVREEFSFMTNVYLNQALMQIGAPAAALTAPQ
jgi:hypothetical protein